MNALEQIRAALRSYRDIHGAREFFTALGYPTIEPLPEPTDDLPEGARKLIGSLYLLVDCDRQFRIYHVELTGNRLRRTDIRRFLESFYRRTPQGDNLFVFATKAPYSELAFVSPIRIKDHRHPDDPTKVRLWLRTLAVNRSEPYRTDLEVLDAVRLDGLRDPDSIWKKHQEAFSVQRVTSRFFEDYRTAFELIRKRLLDLHRSVNNLRWAHDYAHQLLNRLMFLYFIQRKGWLLGEDGKPNPKFVRSFWKAYKDRHEEAPAEKNAFHRDWLNVLFFEAFNNRWQNRAEYTQRFPDWIIRSLAQVPYLNGGLFTPNRLDDSLSAPLPDEVFKLLFDQWMDWAPPGFLERYNFTIVEGGRFDEEVAVDPEMIGRVYESLVNITERGLSEADLRGQAGIFYTPRTEIDLMCRLSLADRLANHLGEKHRSLLTEWVFAYTDDEKEEADRRVTDAGLWDELDGLVQSLTVCDPAVGSGSFLVSMMLILDDLQERCARVLGRTETPYERRKRIIAEQLYGVDVMEWAARVCELRLWLQLVVETELHPAELKFRPLLPNLSFKVRPGDSLVQTVGDLDFSRFHREHLPILPQLKGKLTQLKGRKLRFFSGEDATLTEEAIRREERILFRDIISERMSLVQKELALMPVQTTLDGGVNVSADQEARRRELERQYGELEKARAAIAPDQPMPFIWDMAFVEIFEADKKGFDIVIGNPPYVRQEKIEDPLGRYDKATYKEKLQQSVVQAYPKFFQGRRPEGRSDLYIYFYFHALSLLNEKGSFCFITSNSWLDVDFGKTLQEFLLKHSHIKAIIDNRAERSFEQADVNTVIVLLSPPVDRPLKEKEMSQRKVRFVALRVPFEEVLSPVIFLELAEAQERMERPEFRVLVRDQLALYHEGLEAPEEGRLVAHHRYVGNKWGGKYLRAPDIFFTILEKGKDKLVRLGDIAEVRFGIKTGANEFFYLQPVELTVKETAEVADEEPMAPVWVRNGAGWDGEIEACWLRPVIKSPREIKTLKVRLEDLSNLIFMPPDEVREDPELLWLYPLAEQYIQWGEGEEYDQRPTCASRQRWWDVGEPINDELAFPERCQQRFFVAYNPDRFLLNKSFYGVQGYEMLGALLMTHVTHLSVEMGGRTPGGGGGPLDVDVVMAQRSAVLNPNAVVSSDFGRALSAFQRLANREVKSIFEELGLPKPSRDYSNIDPEQVSLDKILPDRRALDKVVFEVLGLTEEEQLQVYRAVVELVKDRLVKAKTV